MKVLVIGSGGREHAIIRKLRESLSGTELFCAPGNGGIASDAVCVPIKATDIDSMVDFAKKEHMDFCIVTPDDPLVLGMADAMEAAGIPAFGPSKAAARIEGSKVFSKNLMRKYNIPTADYQVFSEPAEALSYIKAENRYPVVLKADGLALGKGVLICENQQDAEAGVTEIMVSRKFGDAGKSIVVEQFLTGPEVSVLAFCDGKTLVPMVSSMDHKRALDGDKGLNTGGMGTCAPNVHYTPEIAAQCMETIFLPTIRAMESEGCPFKGCLYFGLMLTSQGPMVIEYNCRFGDPETQVVLPLLESNLLDIMQAVRNGTLTSDMVRFSDKACVCVVIASGGYPQIYETGFPIDGLTSNGQHPLGVIYHAGTVKKGKDYLTSGGRVLGVVSVGNTMQDAMDRAYTCADTIGFTGAHMRRDIGQKNLR